MAKLDKTLLLDMYKMMVRIREFENEAIELAKANLTRAAVHTYQGQEAIAVGVCASLGNDDYITSTHRGHGHCIAKGADMYKMFAELMGRVDGYCRGKGGSMHIADVATGNLGANGIVGGGIPIAMGAGLALQLSGKKNVSVAFFGDGASNQGSFHEALNMASIWSLPVVFICEDNKYGISTPTSKSLNVDSLAKRAAGYGIEGIEIDGNDIRTVYNTFKEVKARVLEGKGPVLLVMNTYRMAGHYFGDNENYRTKEEVNSWKEKDPLLRCEALLREEYGVGEDEIEQIKKAEREGVLEACDRAKESPEPSLEELTTDLYVHELEDIVWKNFQKSNSK